MDVEFEEVEEFVGHEGDGAVEVVLCAEVQLERALGFVACREGDVLQGAGGVGDLWGG